LNDIGLIAEMEWKRTAQLRQNINLDEYVIMPNHIHGIIRITNHIVGATRRVDQNNYNNNGTIDPIDIKNYNKNRATEPIAPTENSHNKLKSNSLGSIIGQFKSVVTKKIRKMENIHFKWQRNYWEHIIRDENDLNRIRTYILENPLKWTYDKYYE
jgi:REP element-mobilizing transposase RayT